MPASVNTKVPIAAADKDANGTKFPGPAASTRRRPTKHRSALRWTGHEYRSHCRWAETGVWCVDVDTSEDHADGVAEWDKIIAEHDPIVTREHRSATGGPHLISTGTRILIGCSSGNLPRGIEVKGQGGYIIVPPSQRKGRSYTVFADIDPIDPPQFLLDLIEQNWSHRPTIMSRSVIPISTSLLTS